MELAAVDEATLRRLCSALARDLSKEKLWPPLDRHAERRTKLTSSTVAHQTKPDPELEAVDEELGAVDESAASRFCSALACDLYLYSFPPSYSHVLLLPQVTEYWVAHHHFCSFAAT